MTKNIENHVVNVNGAQLDLKDQQAKNGIVHFVDEVIYPIPAGSLVEVHGVSHNEMVFLNWQIYFSENTQ